MELSVIENEALKLSQLDRALLADHLMESLAMTDAHAMKAWTDEGEHRLALFRDGKIFAVDGESVVAALRNKS